MDCSLLAEYGEVDFNDNVTTAARCLLMYAYGGRTFVSLHSLRAHILLSGKSQDLIYLPPTDDAFKLHLL